MTDDRSDQPASVRTFVRARQYGVLSTLSVDVPGYPFGSITPYVVTHEGRVVILVSEIAQHTKNMRACSKASLLVSDDKADDKAEDKPEEKADEAKADEEDKDKKDG